MSSEEVFKFEIDEPSEKFRRHLDIDFNDRIILSAPFGAGKTYFLNEFFKNQEEYEAIHLYPVNYSVASNEDIFELIKFDILYELLGKNVDFEKENFSKLDYLPFFFQENGKKVLDAFTPLIASIPLIGKSLFGVAENLKKLLKQFEDEFKGIQIDDKASVLEYLEAFTQKPGSTKEEDFYTQLICQLVNQLKDNDQKKKTVLVIDDLDRIDPEHIFRILNVLAAQIDKNGNDNKFDFDKIVLVFDQQNVRNIFGNRYGTNVDYTGYIDKFYSYKIFEFSNAIGLKKEIRRLLNTIQINGGSIALSIDKGLLDDATFLFEKLIEANTVTPRRLLKILNSPFSISSKPIKFKGSTKSFSERQFSILLITKLLLHVFEEWEDLLKAVEKIMHKMGSMDSNQREIIPIIEHCLAVLDINGHDFKVDQNLGYSPSVDSPIEIQYRLHHFPMERSYGVSIIPNSVEKLRGTDLFKILYDTLSKIEKDHLIQ